MRRGFLKLNKLSDVVIYPFFECNLRCRGCPVKLPSSRKIGFLKSDPADFDVHVEIEHIRRIAQTWNVKNFVILGGEPTLSKSILYLLNELSASDGSKIIVYTNGTLIYDYLIKNGWDVKMDAFMSYVDLLIVSLEGDKYWTSILRGRGVYDKVVYVVDKLLDKKKDVIVRMSYFKDNVNSVVNEIERFSKEGVKVVLFPRIGETPLSVKETHALYTIVSSYENADILLPSYKNFLGLNQKGVACPAGWAKVCLLPDGWLTPCQWNFDKVAHMSWKDEWIEDSFRWWYRYNSRIRDVCITCRYVTECRGSCRAARDYLSCPVAKGIVLKDVDIELFGEVREVRRSKILARMKKMEGMVLHGCTAAC